MQSQDATSIRRYVLIRDEHSDVPGVRRTGRTGRKVLFLLMQGDVRMREAEARGAQWYHYYTS